MSWNYRVFRRTHPTGEVEFAIHEAYYRSKDVNDLEVTSEEIGYTGPVEPHGETLEGLRKCLQLMLKALDKPVLEHENDPSDLHKQQLGLLVPGCAIDPLMSCICDRGTKCCIRQHDES